MQKSGSILIPEHARGMRLDAFLAREQPGPSRSRWQELIRQRKVQLDGTDTLRPNLRLRGGEQLTWQLPEEEPQRPQPEAIPLAVLYEDDALLAVNKPPGLVVHPGAGHPAGTLVNALLQHDPAISAAGDPARPGIVHRLDKDTSGVILAAKTDAALRHLQAQFKNRTVHKLYQAVVCGHPHPAQGRIETALGRHPLNRKKMAVLTDGGKAALTDYETLEPFQNCALLACRIGTGRTHQIRVHLSQIGHPVVGDSVYGGRRRLRLPAPADRQMLHARRIELRHPASQQPLVIEAPLFEDMENLIDALRGSTLHPMNRMSTTE
jgi:23S rRNA pseudouridine1911/1915/1917 synthase